jgi:aminoglycoside phosphotransferase
MKEHFNGKMDAVLAWCASVLGPIELLSDHSKAHGEHESTTCRLQIPSGICYLKVHESRFHWHNEVHAYEHWARSFGDFAPRLLAVRDEEPQALVVSELPGRILEEIELEPVRERAIWRSAGAALVRLHDSAVGERFGPCLRDGRYRAGAARSAVEHISGRFGKQIERALQGRYLSEEELRTVRTAHELAPAFEGERPLPCHRDYCAANLLVDDRGDWAGVIDFEFAGWDVRVADFSRDPNWAWIRRPDLFAAFVDGYGRPFTPAEEVQLVVAHTEYALDAILWGRDNAFYGFEQEGHEALARLAAVLSQDSPKIPH